QNDHELPPPISNDELPPTRRGGIECMLVSPTKKPGCVKGFLEKLIRDTVTCIEHPKHKTATSLNTQELENLPKIEELKNEMEMTIKKFTVYSIMKVVDGDRFVTSKLEAINRERDSFMKFVEKSIDESNKLHSFAESLIVFAECCEDKSISDNELLDALKSLKVEAINNRKSAENLKYEIERIKPNLKKVRKDLINYNTKIEKSRKNMDSPTRDKLSEAKFSATGGLVLAGVGLFVSLLAIPFTGSASAIPAAELIAGLGSGAFFVGAKNVANQSIQYCYINYKLKGERDKLVDQIGELNNGLVNVYVALGKFITHFDDQETHINDLIEKTQSNGSTVRISNYTARVIAKKWKKISQESMQYTTTMRKLLCHVYELDNLQPKKY
ncbi:1753_t:CDS:2, partial [Entrophospora sp. SA101]